MMADLEVGFAKLQGEDFEYYMQTYSIVLGRNSKKSAVDVDLAGLGGGMNISRQHARIFYDFERKRFALDVLGKNGCHVEGMLYLPGHPAIKLDSQYLLQIGDKKFYFLLPTKCISKSPPPAPLSIPALPPVSIPSIPFPGAAPVPIPIPATALASAPATATTKKRSAAKAGAVASTAPAGAVKSEDILQQQTTKKARGQKKQEGLEMTVDRKPSSWPSHDGGVFMMPSSHPRQGMIFHSEPRADSRKRVETGGEASQMQVEEKEVVSAVATVLSDLCGPGEWMPMPKLYSELMEHCSGIWPQSRVRRFLTVEDSDGDSKGKPWVGLLALLRKYPEHFVINTKTKGRVTSEFVSLVSLLS